MRSVVMTGPARQVDVMVVVWCVTYHDACADVLLRECSFLRLHITKAFPFCFCFVLSFCPGIYYPLELLSILVFYFFFSSASGLDGLIPLLGSLFLFFWWHVACGNCIYRLDWKDEERLDIFISENISKTRKGRGVRVQDLGVLRAFYYYVVWHIYLVRVLIP